MFLKRLTLLGTVGMVLKSRGAQATFEDLDVAAVGRLSWKNWDESRILKG